MAALSSSFCPTRPRDYLVRHWNALKTTAFEAWTFYDTVDVAICIGE